VVCGVWCVVCGVWCVVCGVWCVVCGVWCVVCGISADTSLVVITQTASRPALSALGIVSANVSGLEAGLSYYFQVMSVAIGRQSILSSRSNIGVSFCTTSSESSLVFTTSYHWHDDDSGNARDAACCSLAVSPCPAQLSAPTNVVATPAANAIKFSWTAPTPQSCQAGLVASW
jgi:hypothetical protein